MSYYSKARNAVQKAGRSLAPAPVPAGPIATTTITVNDHTTVISHIRPGSQPQVPASNAMEVDTEDAPPDVWPLSSQAAQILDETDDMEGPEPVPITTLGIDDELSNGVSSILIRHLLGMTGTNPITPLLRSRKQAMKTTSPQSGIRTTS